MVRLAALLALVFATVPAFADPPLAIPNTAQFYQNLGANVSRIGDRLFVGAATSYDGTPSATQPDFFSQFRATYGAPTDQGSWMPLTQAAIFGEDKDYANIGLTVAIQSLHRSGYVTGILSEALSNGTADTFAATDEIHRLPGGGVAGGREIQAHNLGSSVLLDPYNYFVAGRSVNLALGSGGGYPVANPVSTPLIIFRDTGQWLSGLIIGANTILAQPPDNRIHALNLPSDYEIVWYSAPGVIAGSIRVAANGRMQIVATGGLYVNGAKIAN